MTSLIALSRFKKIDIAASGANEIVPAVSGGRIRVVGYSVVATGAVTATWKSGTTALSGAMSIAANGVVSVAAEGGVIETAVGEALNITLSGAVQLSGHLSYIVM